jgi:hypothetical protein
MVLADAFKPHWLDFYQQEQTQSSIKSGEGNGEQRPRRDHRRGSGRVDAHHWCCYRLEWGLLRLTVRYQALALILASGTSTKLETLPASEPHLWEDVIEVARGAFFSASSASAMARTTDSRRIHPAMIKLGQRAALRLLATAAATWKWEKPLLSGMLHGRGHGWLFQDLNSALEEQQSFENGPMLHQAEQLELCLSTMGRLLRRERRLHQLDPRLQLLLVGLFQKLATVIQRSGPASLPSIWSLQFCTLVLRQARPDDAFFGMLRPELETIQRALLEQLPVMVGRSLSTSPERLEQDHYRQWLMRQPWAQEDAALALVETFGSLTLLESTWIRVAWRFLLLRYGTQAAAGGGVATTAAVNPLLPPALPALASTSPVPSPRLGGQAANADRLGSMSAPETAEPFTLHQTSIRLLLEQVLRHPRCFGGAVWSVAAQTLALAMNEDPANAAVFWEEHTVDGLRQVLAAGATSPQCLPATASAYVAAWHALDALCIRREQLEALLEPEEEYTSPQAHAAAVEEAPQQTNPMVLLPAASPERVRLPSMESMLRSLVQAALHRPVLARALFQSGHDLSESKGLLKRGEAVLAVYEQVVFRELQAWLAERLAQRPAVLFDSDGSLSSSVLSLPPEWMDESLAAFLSRETTRLVSLETAFVFLDSLRKLTLTGSRLASERRSTSLSREQLDQLQTSLWQEALISLQWPLALYFLSATADRMKPAFLQLVQVTEAVRRHVLRTGSVVEPGRIRSLLACYLRHTLPLVLHRISPVHCATMRAPATHSAAFTEQWVGSLRSAPEVSEMLSATGGIGMLLVLLALQGQRFKQKYRFRASTSGSGMGAASGEGQFTDSTLLHAVGCLERICRFALAQCNFETVTVYPVPLPSRRNALEIEVVIREPSPTSNQLPAAIDDLRACSTAAETTSPSHNLYLAGASATGNLSSNDPSGSGTELTGMARALALFAVHVRSFYQCVLHETELDTALADVLVGHWAATETLFTGQIWDLTCRPEPHLQPAQCVYLVGLVSSLRALLQESSLPRKTSRRLLSVLYTRGWPVLLLRLVQRLVPPVTWDTSRALDALFDLLLVSLTVEDMISGDAAADRLRTPSATLHPLAEQEAVLSRTRPDANEASREPPLYPEPERAPQAPPESTELPIRTAYLSFLSVMIRLLLQGDWSAWPRLFVLRLLNLVRLLLVIDVPYPRPWMNNEPASRWRTTERRLHHRNPDLMIDSEQALWSFVESYGQGSGFPIRPARMDLLLPMNRRLIRLLQIGHRRQRVPLLYWPWFQTQLRVWARQQALDRLSTVEHDSLKASLVAECWSLLPPSAWLGDQNQSDHTNHNWHLETTTGRRVEEHHPLARLLGSAPLVAMHWLARLGVSDSSVALLRTLVEYLEPILRSNREPDRSLPTYLVLYALIMRLLGQHSLMEPTVTQGRSPDRQGYLTTLPYIPRGVLTAHLPRLLARQALGILWQYRWKRVRPPTALEQMLTCIRPLWTWAETQSIPAIAAGNQTLLWYLLDLDLAALEAVVAAAHIQVRVAAPSAAEVLSTVYRIGHVVATLSKLLSSAASLQESRPETSTASALMARELHAWFLLAEYVRMAFYEHDIGLLIAAFDRVLREAFREAHTQTGQHQGSVSAAALNPTLERLQTFHPMALMVSVMRCLRPVEASSTASSRDRRSEGRYVLNADRPPIATVRIDGQLVTLLLSQRHPGVVLALVSALSTYGAPLAVAMAQLLNQPRFSENRTWLVRCLALGGEVRAQRSAGGSAAAIDWHYLSARALVVHLSAYAGEPQALALRLLTEALRGQCSLARQAAASRDYGGEGMSSSSSSSSSSPSAGERKPMEGALGLTEDVNEEQVMERLASLTIRILVHDAKRALANTETADLLFQLYEYSFHRAKRADALLDSIYQLAVFHGPGLLQFGPDQNGRYPLLKNGAVLDGHRLCELLRSLPSVKSDLFDYGAELGVMGRAQVPEPVLDPSPDQAPDSLDSMPATDPSQEDDEDGEEEDPNISER